MISRLFFSLICVLFAWLSAYPQSDTSAASKGVFDSAQNKNVPLVTDTGTGSSTTAKAAWTYSLPSYYTKETDKKINDERLPYAIKAGRALTTTGLVLHFSGIGLSLLSSIIPLERANVPLMVTLNGIGSALFITGPILSCAGASGLEKSLSGSGIHFKQTLVWQEYGSGWAFTVAGAALFAGGTFVFQTQFMKILTVIAGSAAVIAGEVMWIRAMVHSSLYINDYEQKTGSLGISPYFDLKGGYGVAAVLHL